MTADYAAKGIRVNAIAPGLILTAMTERLLTDQVYRELILQGTPIGRPGEVGDVANLIAFLASDKAAFICGQTIVIDGGWTAARVRNND
jgi:NAD(P)-dependent dehydrogenase (short-subunit alcohol dehydrogenase family)